MSTVSAASIEILAVRGMTSVQDRGRPGWMHQGVPPGGALVPELAAGANRSAGNAMEAALLEVFGGLTLAARGARVRLATEDGAVHDVAPDELLDVRPRSSLRVRYVAALGGLDVPRVLGGRGTLRVAALGGHAGRALRAGDRIAVGVAPAEASTPARDIDLTAAVRIVRGPDHARFQDDAAVTLVSTPFTILDSSDRTGTRLAGPPLRRRDPDSGRSAPMVAGAIQVPTSGQPIVLGPDHPTTGGYPILGVVAHADLGGLFARPIGSAVRFTWVTLDEARALVIG